MEGMPRLPMLAPDFKVSPGTLPPEFASRIKEYILTHYEDNPAKYEKALAEMDSLKAKFSRPAADVETLCSMKRYFAQLTMMKSRFPMEEGDPIRIPFSWLDKAMDVPGSTVYEDVNFELACVMFDIGAVHAAIAANESRGDLDSIKNAFSHFQCAAFPLQEIRDHMRASRYACVDFEPSYLTFFVNVLLAQAQECMLEKSLIDHRKQTVIAKIAIYLRDLYRQCKELLESSVLNDVFSSSKYKEWLRTCALKSELYGAIAMVQLGEQAELESRMGHRLAYYEVALTHVKTAMAHLEKDRRESLAQAVVFVHDVVVTKEANAKKENDFIYHDRIPKAEELRVVEGVSMVKAIGFDTTDRSIAGDDLFAELLPMDVIRSVSMYSEEKANLKRLVLQRVALKDKELDDYLASLQLEEVNLDSSVDDLKLPEMLLERSAALSAQPDAFPDLLEKLQRVGSCAIEADHKLDDLMNRLAAIDSADITADKGFMAIKKELTRINEHHMKARSNNTELQRAIAAHSENLRILAMPIHELNRRISGPAIKPSETAEGALLKRMLNKTSEMRTQRCQLISDLTKELDGDDITLKCLAEKDSDGTELYKKELTKHDDLIKLIDMNLAAQANILTALTDANASFADCRRQVTELNKSRTEQILALTAAYDVCMDVRHKADEGLKFYSTLFSMVRVLDEAIEGMENAFEAEKKAKDAEKRKLEERARELRMAREAREAKDALTQFAVPTLGSALSSGIGGPATIASLQSQYGRNARAAGPSPAVGGPMQQGPFISTAGLSAANGIQSPTPVMSSAGPPYGAPSTLSGLPAAYGGGLPAQYPYGSSSIAGTPIPGNAFVSASAAQPCASLAGTQSGGMLPQAAGNRPPSQLPLMSPILSGPSSVASIHGQSNVVGMTGPSVSASVPYNNSSTSSMFPSTGGGLPQMSLGMAPVQGPFAASGMRSSMSGIAAAPLGMTPGSGMVPPVSRMNYITQVSSGVNGLQNSSKMTNGQPPMSATMHQSCYGGSAAPTGGASGPAGGVQDPFDMASAMAGFQAPVSAVATLQPSCAPSRATASNAAGLCGAPSATATASFGSSSSFGPSVNGDAHISGGNDFSGAAFGGPLTQRSFAPSAVTASAAAAVPTSPSQMSGGGMPTVTFLPAATAANTARTPTVQQQQQPFATLAPAPSTPKSALPTYSFGSFSSPVAPGLQQPAASFGSLQGASVQPGFTAGANTTSMAASGCASFSAAPDAASGFKPVAMMPARTTVGAPLQPSVVPSVMAGGFQASGNPNYAGATFVGNYPVSGQGAWAARGIL